MDYNQLIKNWHSKASEEDYFSKFVFEYLAFIAFLKKKRFTSAYSDRHAIQLLKQDQTLKDLYQSELSNNDKLKEYWEKIRGELSMVRLANSSGHEENEDIKWWNCSQVQLEDQSKVDREKIKGVIYGLDDWENMVEFWYSIRNNLFHGAKDPEHERDQILIQFGYQTLSPLVKVMLDSRDL